MRVHLRRVLFAAICVALLPVLYFLLWTPNFGGRRTGGGVLPRHHADTSGTCSYKNCNPVKAGKLNVHIIPHTHDDTGWVKTLDQYYSGQGGGNAESHSYGGECVSCIMGHVIPVLEEQPERRFIYAEMAFLHRWMADQTPEMQAKVRRLVKERRLEIIGGGWCVSDAATPYYNDIIDQHTLGFDYINRTFGPCAQPRSGWHIDQFGHSREHSSLLAQMGLDSLFVGRLDTQDWDRRAATKNMEFLWKASPDNLGDKATLFTSVLYDGYFAPQGFNMEGWGPGMISESTGSNFASRFLDIVTVRAKAYKSNHIAVPFGGDFAYNTAEGWFANIDELIKAVNAKQASGGEVNLLYSTPACYTYYVNQEGLQWETAKTDLLPYSIVPNAYWTGYFTSRAGLKRHIKVASALLQTCKVFPILAGRITKETKAATFVLKSAVGILQHHDAITGTEKQHVTDDYNKMLSKGEEKCQEVLASTTGDFLERRLKLDLIFCPDLNISRCDVTETKLKFQMVIFNSLSFEVTEYVRVPVMAKDFTVTDSEGQSVPSQMFAMSEATRRIPERRREHFEGFELVIQATVPPLGIASFSIKSKNAPGQAQKPRDPPNSDFTISNDALQLVVDASTGRFKSLENLAEGVLIKLDQDFRYYIGWKGEPRHPGDSTMVGTHRRASGAYAFIPRDDQPPARVNDGKVKFQVVKDALVEEVHQEFSPWLTQVARLYRDAGYLELEWTVGPIPNEDKQSREIVSMFMTDLASKGRFYTDSNGREMITRIRNYRETFKWNNTSPFSGNYYPVPSRIFIKDEDKSVQLTVLTDRCQGGSSMQDGQLELMVQRRTMQDDDLGVGEPLNERGIDGKGIIFRGRHYVLLNQVKTAAASHRPLALQLNQQPTVAFLNHPAPLVPKYTGLRTPLPPNVHLLTLDQHQEWEETLLIRLENFYEKGESDSPDAEVQLKRLLTPFDIVSVEELNLGASDWVNMTSRLQWVGEDGIKTPFEVGSDKASKPLTSPFDIRIRPMEIRTFRVTTGMPTTKSWFWGD